MAIHKLQILTKKEIVESHNCQINKGLVNWDTYSWNVNDYEYSHASQGKQQCEQNLHAIRWKNHWLLVTRICLQFCFIGTVFFIVDVVVNWGDDDMFLSSNSQSWVHSSPRFFWNLMITCPKDIGVIWLIVIEYFIK